MVFILSALWCIRIRSLWRLPDGRDWLRGKLGLVLMGRAMLSKSSTQISVDRAVFPPCCLTWGQTMVEVMKIMATSFKRSHALSAPDPAAGRRWPTPLPETPGHSWASLRQSIQWVLVSPGSWCTQGFVCALQESVSPALLSSDGFMVGLMATSSKRAYAIPRSAAPRAPASGAVHCWPLPSTGDTQTEFHLSLCGDSGSWCTQGLFEPSKHLWQVWDLILNAISPLLSSCWGFFFAFGHGIYFFGGIQHSPVTGHLAGSCNLGCHYVRFFSFFF